MENLDSEDPAIYKKLNIYPPSVWRVYPPMAGKRRWVGPPVWLDFQWRVGFGEFRFNTPSRQGGTAGSFIACRGERIWVLDKKE
jgi:hypothetical protein